MTLRALLAGPARSRCRGTQAICAAAEGRTGMGEALPAAPQLPGFLRRFPQRLSSPAEAQVPRPTNQSLPPLQSPGSCGAPGATASLPQLSRPRCLPPTCLHSQQGPRSLDHRDSRPCCGLSSASGAHRGNREGSLVTESSAQHKNHASGINM